MEQPDMQGVVDHEKICVGDLWPLASHQFRRTFAVFVAPNLLADVRYLREHFKHWSIDMTLYYTRHDDSVDMTVFSDVLTERDELQAIIMEKWIKTDAPLSGGVGALIMTFRNRGNVKTVSDMREFCRRLGEDVYVRGTGTPGVWQAATGVGDMGFMMQCFVPQVRTASLTTLTWQSGEGSRQQQIEVLQCPDLGLSSWQRDVDHLRKAEKKLTDLGDLVTPYQVSPSPFNGVDQ